MTPAHVILTAVLATVPSGHAQQGAELSQPHPTWPVAVNVPARQAMGRAVAEAREAARGDGDQRRAGRAGDGQQRDNPRASRAEPRREQRERTPDRARAPEPRRTVVVRPQVIYNNHYLSRGRIYGYGPSFGPGYFYYSPYRGYPGASLAYVAPGGYRDPYGYQGYQFDRYGSQFGRYGSQFDIGELRLQLSPRDAQVYVDGYYAGTVDDYDGTFQALKLESGSYQIEIVAPGYETRAFDVRIYPGQKVTYREDLRRIR